eukprot:CAMPEP_0196593222 /NCGR_PEP_ID=MMETSP1081-20130531/75072_1 /TAXON_ID=36882 /ORGANISM="Pyramimonas amylifera, Strain CCMP720" /LENGTH=56 /DNA_ID=CAMNT_0041917143 /DNA_START=48 /DNA_END=215 /DNA_ORIENTATION=+
MGTGKDSIDLGPYNVLLVAENYAFRKHTEAQLYSTKPSQMASKGSFSDAADTFQNG